MGEKFLSLFIIVDKFGELWVTFKATVATFDLDSILDPLCLLFVCIDQVTQKLGVT